MEKNDRYVLLFGGIVSLVFGILLITQTGAALTLVMLLLGLSWFIQGIFTLLSIFIDKSRWGWKLFGGVIGIAAGLLVFSNPVASTVAGLALVAILVGLFGVLIGISALIGAFQGEGWGAGIFGAVSLIIGLLLIFNAWIGAELLVTLTALLLVVQGIVGVVFSFIKK